jgi:small subunit ribosomal protein S3
VGQKTRPIGLRIGINRTWDSRWYAGDKEYADNLHQDLAVRKHIDKTMRFTGVSKVVIERSAKKVRITLSTSRPGVIIGKKGADIESIKNVLSKIVGSEVNLNIVEIRKPETDAKLVGEAIAQQLEKRVSFRRAMKRAMQSAMKMGAQGIRINCSGRLGGAEIARMEWYREGRVPLHTLRADIDYGLVEAHTAYGIIGIKVWIYRGDIYTKDITALELKKAANDQVSVKEKHSA